jgi:hypothetical protein
MRYSVKNPAEKIKAKCGIVTEFYTETKTSGTYIMVNIVLNGVKVNVPTRISICL